MSDPNQSAGESGGKSGGRKRKRPYRNRRRNRKPQNEKTEIRNEDEGSRTRPKNNRRSGSGAAGSGRNNARGKPKSAEAGLDPVKRARRDRRRRKRSGDADNTREAVVAPVAPMPDLEIEPKQVFVYTHVLRPSLRDAYEYRAEHFSHNGRTLDDFRIDLSSIFIFPEGDPEGEPVIDLHIGRGPDADSIGEDADWDDDEPFGDEPPAIG